MLLNEPSRRQIGVRDVVATDLLKKYDGTHRDYWVHSRLNEIHSDHPYCMIFSLLHNSYSVNSYMPISLQVGVYTLDQQRWEK